MPAFESRGHLQHSFQCILTQPQGPCFGIIVVYASSAWWEIARMALVAVIDGASIHPTPPTFGFSAETTNIPRT
jgi:hypothetical protein